MKTKDLILLPRWIRTDSLWVGWYNNEQMRWMCDMKNGKWYGDSKSWNDDGSLRSHNVWENGKRIKIVV